MMTELWVLTTGGTLDAVAYAKTPENVAFEGHSKVGITLTNLQAEGRLDKRVRTIHIREVCQKDSKDLTEADREALAAAIEQASDSYVLVTHGTDRMPETARWLKKRITGKHVAITGSMKPLAHGDPASDGFQNLVDAISMLMADALPGVWIVMNGTRINPDRAVKDFEKLEIYESDTDLV